MNKNTETTEQVQFRINALRSYMIYLRLLQRCEVKRMPMHGWVA